MFTNEQWNTIQELLNKAFKNNIYSNNDKRIVLNSENIYPDRYLLYCYRDEWFIDIERLEESGHYEVFDTDKCNTLLVALDKWISGYEQKITSKNSYDELCDYLESLKK